MTMDNHEIEKHLANAIGQTAPDILDELTAELGFEPDINNDEHPSAETASAVSISERRRQKMHRRFMTAAAAAAAAFVIMFGSISFFKVSNAAAAVISMDVNPGIELDINKSKKVISARAINDEASEILEKTRLKGMNISDACSLTASVLAENGYLNSKSNSLLLSVRADDPAVAASIREELTRSLLESLKEQDFSAAVLSLLLEDNEELAEFAAKNGISFGKAMLIKKLLASGSAKMTEESLLRLSTQELILLAFERHIDTEDSFGEADKSSYIGKDAAADIALNDAGASLQETDGMTVEYDCEDGLIIYEVDFSFDSQEYEYEIDAVTGSILSREVEGDLLKPAKTEDASDYDDDENPDIEDDADDDDDRDDADDVDDDRDDADDVDYDDQDNADDVDDDRDDADDADDDDQDNADDVDDDDRDDADDVDDD